MSFSVVDPCLTSGAMSLLSNGKSVSTQASTLADGVFFPRNFPLLLKLYGFVLSEKPRHEIGNGLSLTCFVFVVFFFNFHFAM